MTRPREPITAIDERGNRHGPFAPTVAADLLRLGILRQVGDLYTIRAADSDIVAHNPAIAVCDLCTRRPVAWSADVAGFQYRDPSGRWCESVGGFALCDPCGQLVAANDRAALIARVVDTAVADQIAAIAADVGQVGLVFVADAARARLTRSVEDLHREFWRHFRAVARLP